MDTIRNFAALILMGLPFVVVGGIVWVLWARKRRMDQAVASMAAAAAKAGGGGGPTKPVPPK